MNTSHELAANLIKLAEWLKSRPEFSVPSVHAHTYQSYYSDTSEFKQAVKALGSGKKSPGVLEHYLRFEPTGVPEGTEITLEVNRQGLCRLVTPAQPAVYECDSLLGSDEVQ